MSYIEGQNRDQLALHTETLDDLLGGDNPVRVIDAFVDSLDMAALGICKARPAATGRPAYDPRVLLKLYLYGYFNRIRSSRRLMLECGRNVELFYLLNRLTPDFRTIADFRKNNAKAIQNVFKAFVRVCMELDLYGKELVAIDGSKFRAVNGRKKMYNEEILNKKLRRIEENVAKYMRELDNADAEDPGTSHYTADEIQAKLAELSKRKEAYEDYLRQLKKTGETQLLTTDPEARMMRTKDGFACCYNVQTAVDAKNHLIADYAVTNDCTDYNSLADVTEQAMQALQAETIHTEADKGYDDAEELRKCLLNGIVPHVGYKDDAPERLIVLDYEEAEITEETRQSTKPEDIRFCLQAGVLPACYQNTNLSIETQQSGRLSCFVRNGDDTVTCPMGRTLTRVKTKPDGSAHYQCRSACRNCPNRCTESKNKKVVKFGPNTKYVPVLMYGGDGKLFTSFPPNEVPYNAFSRMYKRAKKTVLLHIKADIPAQRHRLCLSEHPFGTVKWYHGAHYLLCKGKQKTTAELGLSFLAYNLRRALNTAGAERLLSVLQV